MRRAPRSWNLSKNWKLPTSNQLQTLRALSIRVFCEWVGSHEPNPAFLERGSWTDSKKQGLVSGHDFTGCGKTRHVREADANLLNLFQNLRALAPAVP